MSQHPEANFCGPLPFPTDTQTLSVNHSPYKQNLYEISPPTIISVPPELLSIPPPPILPAFVSSVPSWSQYTQQSLQYSVQENNQQFNFIPSDQFTPVINENYGNSTEDNNWVESWLKRIGKLPNKVGKKNATVDIKIFDIKELLSAANSIIKELENASVTLNVMMKSVSNLEWDSKCQEIENKKQVLSELLLVLKLDPMKLADFKEKLKKRKAKRDRLKRQSLKRKMEKKACEENREKLHQQIDMWLEEMKESVERNKREEELKREADSILWEVTQKKTEARRQIGLLTSLLQLRDAKAKSLKSSGKYVSDSDVTAFNSVIEKLKTLWERQLKGYLIEEQGLREMLTKGEGMNNSHGEYVKQTLNEWEAAIFGSKYNDATGEPQDLEEFVQVRHSWDHFVANEKTVMASTIPVGWILPTKPSDPNWAKSLKYMKK